MPQNNREMSVETRARALLLQMVTEGVADPTKSAIAALKTERNNVKCAGVNTAVTSAKHCLIALREIEFTRGSKATRDVKATPDVLSMCASSDEEKQAAKTAWDVKIAAKIVERKAAQKLHRDKPSVRRATKDRVSNKRSSDDITAREEHIADGGLVEDFKPYNEKRNAEYRQKLIDWKAAGGAVKDFKLNDDRRQKRVDWIDGGGAVKDYKPNENKRQKLLDHIDAGGAVKDYKLNVDAREPARREKRRLLVEKNQLAAAHETSRRNFQHSIHKYGELC